MCLAIRRRWIYFKGDDPIGQTMWVNRKPCQVIGVVTELEAVTVQDRIGTRPNEGIILPISFAILNLFDEEPWVTVIAHVKDEMQNGGSESADCGVLASAAWYIHRMQKATMRMIFI